jgi:superfamily II DNA or RNA helicase
MDRRTSLSESSGGAEEMNALRDYQAAAVDATYREWEEKQSTLLVFPTGTGKTEIFCHVIAKNNLGRAMIVAHREELIWQAANRIKQITGENPSIEMAEMKGSTGLFSSGTVIASVQTLISGGEIRRVEKFNPQDFAMLVCDECHHCTAKSWRFVIDHFRKNPNCKILGVTATPDRADEQALGQIFDSVAMDYEIIEAIEDGWLVPILQRYVICQNLDISACRTTAGDLNGADLARVMEYEEALHEIATPSLDICGERKAIIFAASVAHAERLCEILNRHKPGCAQWLCGETPKDVRRDMLSEFASKKFQFIINVGVLTEGYDDPTTEVIIMARPTKSRALYAQMAGRGTRPMPGLVDQFSNREERKAAIAGSAKPSLEIIDFVGNSGKHKLMTSADILGGNYDDEILELAARNAIKTGMAVDMRQQIQDAARQKHEEVERAKREEAARRMHIRASAQYNSREVNPFDVFDLQPSRERGWDKGRVLTDKQRNLLLKQGINPDEYNYADCKRLIGQIIRGWDKKECSYKQKKILWRFRLPTDVERTQGGPWIDAIAKNNWRLPPELMQYQLKSRLENIA